MISIVASFQTYFKLIFLFFNIDIHELITSMAQDWKMADKVILFEMKKNLAFVKFMVKFALYGIVGADIVFVMLKIHTSFYKLETDSINSSNKQFYGASKFFFNVQTSPTYELVWLCQVITTVLGCIVYHDGFRFISVFHACSQLNILRMDVKNLSSRSKEENFNTLVKNIVER